MAIGSRWTSKISSDTVKNAFKGVTAFGSKRVSSKKLETAFKNAGLLSGRTKDVAKFVVNKAKGKISAPKKFDTNKVKTFFKKAPDALKKAGIGLSGMGRSLKSTPDATFQKKLVETELKSREPSGPSKDQLAKQAEIKEGNFADNRFDRLKENYGGKDPLAVARGETDKPAEQVNIASPEKRTNNDVHFARGMSLPKSKGVDTGTSFVGTFGQDDNNQKDTSTNISTGKVTDINKYREEKEKNKNNKKNAENLGKFGTDIDVVDDVA